MKKRILTAICTILLLSLLLSAIGCNSSVAEETEATDEEATEAPTEPATEKPTQKPTEKPAEKPKTEDNNTSLSKKVYNISKDWKNFKLLGRMQDVEGGVACDFTASGIDPASGRIPGERKITSSVMLSRYSFPRINFIPFFESSK